MVSMKNIKALRRDLQDAGTCETCGGPTVEVEVNQSDDSLAAQYGYPDPVAFMDAETAAAVLDRVLDTTTWAAHLRDAVCAWVKADDAARAVGYSNSGDELRDLHAAERALRAALSAVPS